MYSRTQSDSTPGVSRGGFTLIEVLAVLTLIGIMAAMALPRIDFQRVRVDSATVRVNSTLLLAQRIAVMRQHDVRVSFDAPQVTLVIHQDMNNDGIVDSGEQTRVEALDDGVQFGVVGAALFGAGDALTFEQDDQGFPTLVFHRNGSASEEGAVHITNRPLGGAGQDRAVRLTRATGLARCWNRRQGSWREGC